MAVIGLSDILRRRMVRGRDWYLDDFPKLRPKDNRELAHMSTEFARLIKAFMDFRRDVMAKKAAKNDTFKFEGYVNIDIPESHQKKAEAWVADEKQSWQCFIETINAGYRVAFSIDERDESYKCNLTCFNPDNENFGYSMSGYGESPFLALGSAMYKHFIIADENWQSVAKKKSGKFR